MSNDNIHIKEVSIDIMKEEYKHKHDIENKKMDMEHDKINNTWESCCLRVDKNMFQYITTTSIISGCVIGSIIGLIITPHTLVFSSLLSLSVGCLLPNPKLQDKHNNKV